MTIFTNFEVNAAWRWFPVYAATLVMLSLPARTEVLRLAVSTPALTKGDPFARYTGGSVKSALFDGLTQISLSGDVTPAIAVQWTALSDTEWVFRLRPGVQFHNGVPLTAASLVALFDYLRSPEAKKDWMAQLVANVKSARAIDALTLSIVTVAPDPLLPRRVSELNIVDIAAWRKAGAVAFSENPVGTGPYKIVSWGPNASNIQFAAVSTAWRQKNNVDTVEMKVLTDGTRRVQALLSGEIDVAVNLDPDGVELLKEAGMKTMVLPNPIVVGIGLKTVGAAQSPILDVRVRRALNYAVNKTAISQQILNGLMPVASQGATPGVTGYNPELAPYAFDPAKARALLSEAGYPNGFAMVMGVWTGQVPGDAQMFQQVAQDLAQVGVRVELRILPFPDFSRRLLSGSWQGIDAFSINWSSRSMFDALPTLEGYSCGRLPAPFFCDPDVDRAIASARYEMNPTLRQRKLQAAMATAVASAPSIFLVNYADVVAMRPNIKGYEVRSDGILFEKISIEPAH